MNKESRPNWDNEEKTSDIMGDVYDIYAKATKVHSKLSSMTDDYTLARYNSKIFEQKLAMFTREQSKVLRVIGSFMIPTDEELNDYCIRLNNTKSLSMESKKKKAKEITGEMKSKLEVEFNTVKALIGGEMDELIIMSRTPEGQVIDAVLGVGLSFEQRDDINNRSKDIGNKLNEERK